MNNLPVEFKTPVKVSVSNKSPYRSPNKKRSVHKLSGKKQSPSKNAKLGFLRTYRDQLGSKKSELEKSTFIEKANSFQTMLYTIAKDITQDNTAVKKKISLLPLPANKVDKTRPAEGKLIEQIEQLQTEIHFLSSNKIPEDINKELDFFIKAEEELQKLSASANVRNNDLADLKKKQELLTQEVAARFRKEALNKPTKKSETTTSVDDKPKRPAFSLNDLQKGIGGIKKAQDVLKQDPPEEKPNQISIIASAGTKSSFLRQYNGYIDIAPDLQLRSAIDPILDGKSINEALQDQKLCVRIFALFNQHEENKHKKVAAINEAEIKKVSIDSKLSDSLTCLQRAGISFKPTPNNEIIDRIKFHILEQITITKEEAIMKQRKLQELLSKLDQQIDTETANLQMMQEALSKQLKPTALAAAEGLSTTKQDDFSIIKAELHSKFVDDLTAMRTEFRAKFDALLEAPEAELKFATQQLSTASTPKPFTPSFAASQSKTADTLSKQTIDFLKQHEFDCTTRSDLNKCTSKKKQLIRYTPLTLATLQINEEVCKSLLSDGADVNAINGVGNTPLHMLSHAASSKKDSIDKILSLAEFFVSKGAILSIKDKNDKTPLDIAINPLLEDKFEKLRSVANTRNVLA